MPTDTRRDLTVQILQALAEHPDPREHIDKVAAQFNLTPLQVRDAALKHGWPRPDAMARAAAALNAAAAAPKAGTVTVNRAPADTATQRIRISDLAPHPSNPEGRTDDVSELAASIEQVGLLQPVVVTAHPNRKGWLILAGHRRVAALRRLGRSHVDCIVRPTAGRDLDEQLLVMLIENLHRQDLTAMEKAYAFGDLRDRRRMSANQISKRSGLSVGTVSYYLSLLELDEVTQAQVQLGQIQITQAIKAVKQVRRERRAAAGEGQPGRPVQLEPAWFTLRHPLARKVTETCTHTTRPTIGHAGCGQCWEATIRADARVTDEAVGA